jgi:ubiquitin-conjugating enzyme E2 Z
MNITKETVNRLLKDIKCIMKNPLNDNGIYYVHDETDILKGYAMIVGPKGTPYFGGFYFFEILFPPNYPHSPPQVLFRTNGDNIRFNPNLYTNGKVCISILNTWKGDQWTSCLTISTILLSLCCLLCENPLLNEPGINMTHNEVDKYTKIIEYKNIEISILKMIKKTENYFMPTFNIFSSVMEEIFNKNNDAIIEFLDKQEIENSKNEVICMNVYSMNVTINYKNLKQEYLEYIKKN